MRTISPHFVSAGNQLSRNQQFHIGLVHLSIAISVLIIEPQNATASRNDQQHTPENIGSSKQRTSPFGWFNKTIGAGYDYLLDAARLRTHSAKINKEVSENYAMQDLYRTANRMLNSPNLATELKEEIRLAQSARKTEWSRVSRRTGNAADAIISDWGTKLSAHQASWHHLQHDVLWAHRFSEIFLTHFKQGSTSRHTPKTIEYAFEDGLTNDTWIDALKSRTTLLFEGLSLDDASIDEYTGLPSIAELDKNLSQLSSDYGQLDILDEFLSALDSDVERSEVRLETIDHIFSKLQNQKAATQSPNKRDEFDQAWHTTHGLFLDDIEAKQSLSHQLSAIRESFRRRFDHLNNPEKVANWEISQMHREQILKFDAVDAHFTTFREALARLNSTLQRFELVIKRHMSKEKDQKVLRTRLKEVIQEVNNAHAVLNKHVLMLSLEREKPIDVFNFPPRVAQYFEEIERNDFSNRNNLQKYYITINRQIKAFEEQLNQSKEEAISRLIEHNQQ